MSCGSRQTNGFILSSVKMRQSTDVCPITKMQDGSFERVLAMRETRLCSMAKYRGRGASGSAVFPGTPRLHLCQFLFGCLCPGNPRRDLFNQFFSPARAFCQALPQPHKIHFALFFDAEVKRAEA